MIGTLTSDSSVTHSQMYTLRPQYLGYAFPTLLKLLSGGITTVHAEEVIGRVAALSGKDGRLLLERRRW